MKLTTVNSFSSNDVPKYQETEKLSLLKATGIVTGVVVVAMAFSTLLFIRWKMVQEKNTPYCCPDWVCKDPARRKPFSEADFVNVCLKGGCGGCGCPNDGEICLTGNEWWLTISKMLPETIRDLFKIDYNQVYREGGLL